MADLATLGIRVTTQGVREAAADLDKLDKSGERTSKRAADLGKAWGVALGGAIAGGAAIAVVGLKKYIDNTIQAEKIQAQLVATIKSTGGAAGLAVGQLNDMADALMRATTFDDESINQVQGLLLTFTKIGGDVFPRATEAVLDMSTALGVDLKSAAMQVGKSLNDPVAGLTALSRAGVQFSETQKETIKDLVETGNVAQAQTLILKELETQMGGSARAARNTLGGALQALQNSFDNLLEGDSGSGGVRGTRDAIESLTRTLNDPSIKRGIDDMASGLLYIANSAIQVVAKLGEAGSAVAEFFGDAQKRSSTMLRNQRNELESQMYGLERRIKTMAPLNSVANPLGILTAVDQDALAKVKREIAEIDAILARRDRPTPRGALFSDQSALPESMLRGGSGGGGAADPDAPARIRDRAKATQELSAAELAHRSIMEDLAIYEDLWAQNSRDAIAAEYDRQKQVENGIASTQALITDMEFELSLLGMTNKERMTAIALRQADVNATDEQIARIRELANAQYEGEKSAALWDNAQRSLSDSIYDAVSGTKSLKDAVLDFLDSLSRSILQQFADDWAQTITKSLRGTMSSGSTGSSSGTDWSSLISDFMSLFKTDGYTGFSKGGYTGPGGKNAPRGIVHAGEYVLNQEAVNGLGLPYLNHLNAGGSPAPMAQPRGPVSVSQTFVVQGRLDRTTQAQLAREQGREASRALSRDA
ncbi:phage tail length tape measure family protein [Pseudoxanthomonas sp.]|uniref:phage tail length tape measure family protein n=1 Tax=Pseudoxanthomonas sp. TaxID=1871049 RepID=UPI0025FADCD7|nr:phage tail length tape measure family protein [Pseudoxanthomonas sp.]